jgi:uncharacterized protein (TIGR03032 family)
MATSQVLTDILNNKNLLVSCISDGFLLNINSEGISKKIIKEPAGIDVFNNFIVVIDGKTIAFYDKNTNNEILKINKDVYLYPHEIKFLNEKELIYCSPLESSLRKIQFLVDEIIWTVPTVDLGTTDKRSWINGVCILNGEAAYATTLGISNIAEGWRDEAKNSRGALIDVRTNEIVLHDLFFPHSPTIINNEIWFANSGNGQLCKWAPGDTDFTVIKEFNAFTRGICEIGDYVIVGLSQGRRSGIEQLKTDPMAQPGLAVVDKNTKEQVDFLPLDVKEIFDIVLTDLALQ